jgi:hypothetical protein
MGLFSGIMLLRFTSRGMAFRMSAHREEGARTLSSDIGAARTPHAVPTARTVGVFFAAVVVDDLAVDNVTKLRWRTVSRSRKTFIHSSDGNRGRRTFWYIPMATLLLIRTNKSTKYPSCLWSGENGSLSSKPADVHRAQISTHLFIVVSSSSPISFCAKPWRRYSGAT